MKQERVLLGLVVLDAVLVFSFLGVEMLFQQTLPGPLRDYVGASDGGWSLRSLVNLQVWAITGLATMLAWVGLLNFWRIARPLYLAAWATYMLLIALSGPQVLTPVGATLQVLDALVGGAILSLVYFSSLSRRYERMAAPSRPREPVTHAVSVVCALAGLGLLLGPAVLHAAQRYTVTGGNVAIYNLAGAMKVVEGRSANVEVEVTVGGDEGAKLRVENGAVGDHQALRVIYPGDRVVYRNGRGNSNTSLNVRSDGTFGGGGGWFDGRKVTISTSGSGLDAWADLTVYVPKGKQVAVHLAVGDASVANVDADLFVDVHAARVRSEHTKGRLRLDTGSGTVDVLDAQGDVSIDTGSGGARVSGVRGERLLVDTGSGEVSGEGIDVDRLSVDTGSGGVDLASVKAPDIKLDTGSGRVTLGLLSDVRSLDIDTGSGGVTISVPETLGAEADIDVGSGGIDIDVPHEVMGKISSDHYRCKIGDGQGRIHIDTGSGGVRLKRG